MGSPPSVIAIVPAAGRGTRFGPGADKPFVELLGRPLLFWALRALQASARVSQIIPVLKEGDERKGRELIEEFGITKARAVARGGHERQDSVLNALRLIGDRDATVLIHDGARPLLDDALIAATLEGLEGHDGAVAAVPLKDSVKEVNDAGCAARTLRRDTLRAVQTPQAFPLGLIMRAYAAAAAEGYYSTDDSALVERRGGRVRLVMGSYENIKITTPEDLEVAAMLLRKRL